MPSTTPQQLADAHSPGWVARYILHPLRLFLHSASILLLFFIVVLFNYVANALVKFSSSTTAAWAYDVLPQLVAQWIRTPSFWIAVTVIFVVGIVLTMAVAE